MSKSLNCSNIFLPSVCEQMFNDYLFAYACVYSCWWEHVKMWVCVLVKAVRQLPVSWVGSHPSCLFKTECFSVLNFIKQVS